MAPSRPKKGGKGALNLGVFKGYRGGGEGGVTESGEYINGLFVKI